MVLIQRIVLLLAFLACFATFANSQNQESVRRPKVGLVLSGGGAKGLAHIGVLKVLEEAGIRPDFITGTSMGSIVGGLYAIGYNASELDSIVRRLDWGHLLSDAVPLTDVMPEEKHDYHRFNVELDYTRDGLKMPGGFIHGNVIYELLARLSIRVAGVQSFDNYPIPFRCVAADLLSGQQYVFKDGDFATALRASMSIPSVFAPVKLDKALLVDGGVLNNFPVMLCKEMGADIIIAVNVGFGDEIESDHFNMPTNVLMASASLSSHVAFLQSLPHVNVLISPDLKAYTMASFLDAGRIVDQGELAARKLQPELAKLAQKLDSLGPQHIKATFPQPNLLKISQVRIAGIERTSNRFFMGNLNIEPGQEISPDDLERGIARLMGTRYYSSVNYQLTPLRDGYILNVNVVEAERARFKFSIHYDNEYKAGIVTNFTLRNILARGNRFSTTLDISENPRLNTSIINYFGERQRTAFRIELTAENNKLPFYLDNGAIYGILTHNYSSISGGFMSSLGTRWELNTFLMYERSVLMRESGFSEIFDAGIIRFGNRFLSGNFTARRNSLNRRFFPTRGSTFDFRYKLYFDIDEVYRGRVSAYGNISDLITHTGTPFFSVYGGFERLFFVADRFVVFVNGHAGFDSKPLPAAGLQFLGGMPFLNRSNEIGFAGLLSRERQLNDFVIAGLKSRFRFLKKTHTTAMVNVAYSVAGDKEIENPILLKPKEQVWGYGLMIEYDSFLGPIQAGAGRNSQDNRFRWYLGFGYSF